MVILILVCHYFVSCQIPVLESLLDKCDAILLGGGMIFTFYRARGISTGSSMVEEDFVDMARELMDKAEAKGVKLVLPTDVVVADRFAADAATRMVSASHMSCHGVASFEHESASVATADRVINDCTNWVYRQVWTIVWLITPMNLNATCLIS